MFFKGIFDKRDVKMFFNESIYQKNNDCIVIRLRSREQLAAYAQLIPIQFMFDTSTGKDVKTLLYCLDEDIKEEKNDIVKITGAAIKFRGKEILDAENFECKISDYNFKINSKLINHDDIASVWRKHIYLHLNEEDKKAYKTKLIDDELKM